MQIVDLFEAQTARYARAGARVEDDLAREHDALSNPHAKETPGAPEETSVTVNVSGISAMHVNERFPERNARLGGDATGTPKDCGEVDAHARNPDSEFSGAPSELRHARRRDRGFRRRTTEVHARAPGILPLGDHHAPGLFSERVGQRDARLSGSDDHEIDRGT